MEAALLDPYQDPKPRSHYKQAADMYLSGVSLEDVEIALRDKEYIDPRTKLPEHYHMFLPLFDQKEANELSPHRECDHKIELQPGKVALPARCITCPKTNCAYSANGFMRTSRKALYALALPQPPLLSFSLRNLVGDFVFVSTIEP